MTKTIEIRENVLTENEKLAAVIKAKLESKGIFTINILGGAGSGKTSAIIQIIRRLGSIPVYVIEGDIASDIDTQTLRSLGVNAYQINTGGTCHLNAAMMESILSQMSIDKPGILIIENIGNLVCPADFVIGENIKLVVSSIPEGSDKPYKYPAVFARSLAVILTKSDLAPYLNFNNSFFAEGVHAVNSESQIFRVSSATGEGFDSLANWIISLYNSFSSENSFN